MYSIQFGEILKEENLGLMNCGKIEMKPHLYHCVLEVLTSSDLLSKAV